MKQLLVCVLLAISSAAIAETDATTAKEIQHLMRYLESSGCEFYRNGSWYDSSRAAAHLQRKYEYLLKRKLVPSAEAFIERAASTSSASNKPYRVRCNGQPEAMSADWFRAELERFRRQARP